MISSMRRLIFTLVLALPLTATAAEAPIIGMPLPELIACAGLPLGQAEVGGQTYLQYAEARETGTVSSFGGIAVFNKRQNSCEATVTVEGGIVKAVNFKKRGGLITRELACNRIFKECR